MYQWDSDCVYMHSSNPDVAQTLQTPPLFWNQLNDVYIPVMTIKRYKGGYNMQSSTHYM